MRKCSRGSRDCFVLRPRGWAWWRRKSLFRALPQYELRGADVAFVSQQRWDATNNDDNLHGSPELVIEVLSPSNTRAEIQEKAALCLSTGAREFWVVDPIRRTVTVTAPVGRPVVYSLAVSDIFVN